MAPNNFSAGYIEMFFSERIQSIKESDRVLEVGPGGSPHPRSDVLLEMHFACEEETQIQRSSTPALKTDKKLVFYDGKKFPFEDNEFDYVICSHVLEHVPNVEAFLSELQRVAKKGYLEFPTIYYDYLYNMPTHINILMCRDGIINYMSKEESKIDMFKDVHMFFYKTLTLSYSDIVKDLKPYFFQGFEWFDRVCSKKVESLSEVSYSVDEINSLPKKQKKKRWGWRKIKNKLKK